MSTPRTKTGNLSSIPTSVSERTQKLTFDGDQITSDWFQPEMAKVMCEICGKRCKELHKPLCVNANPYCG